MSIKDIKMMMGTVVDKEWTYKGTPKTAAVEAKATPASFDART